jgi:alpha,alpha-trehalase
MQQYLWDEESGLFFDYDFDNSTRSTYRYATTFYPLWAGMASDAQARAVIKNLSVFEQPGGLAMSTHETEGQWDYPFGWAPIQLLAVEGMRHYGYNAEADRVSIEFLSTVLENFERDKTIREKYNVVTQSSDTNVKAGYAANVIGFGWTNATFVELLHELPPNKIDHVAEAVGPPALQGAEILSDSTQLDLQLPSGAGYVEKSVTFCGDLIGVAAPQNTVQRRGRSRPTRRVSGTISR